MSDATTLERTKMKLAIATAKDPHYVEGRRSFFKYRDLGVTEGTGGRMRAQITSATAPMDRETGWHYHTCEMQFVYLLRGWADLEFEGGRKVHLTAGDSLMIPGGAPHQELRTSDDFEILEVSVPAEMGTVPCDPPA
ncbi:MAG TPA: cupin domain-containing protein [Stellaceae bacterium]|nr:cupin domain-containing protein [Stellaceae bacterium]